MTRNRYRRTRAKTHQTKKQRYSRLDILRVLFMLGCAVIVVRLIDVQILRNGYYTALAFDSQSLFQTLFPKRGEIFVQDKYSSGGTVPIAANQTLADVEANPAIIKNPQAMAEALAPLLDISVTDLVQKLSKPNSQYQLLKRRVSTDVVKAIQALNSPDIKHGVAFQYSEWRYYPEADSTAHITGYFGYASQVQSNGVSQVGKYGLEGYFNDVLAGKIGTIKNSKTSGQLLAVGGSDIQPAINGADLVLTIDKNVQFYACQQLALAVQKHGAKTGTVIIMNPATGAILAMCDYPSFDPNNYNQVPSVDVFTNNAIATAQEPGSVFKTFTMAAGIDQGLVSPDTTYTDSGTVQIGGYHIRNSDGKANGVVPMTVVLQKSLNTGAIWVVQKVGDAKFYQYIHDFGFGEPTHIELAGEQSGTIAQLAKQKAIYTATASFGQGITVTPIQLIAAYSAIANGGELMKPYIVAKTILPTGQSQATVPQTVRRVISAQTAQTIGAMLVSVVDKEHKSARVPGYFMGGKTGTAQVVVHGGYDADRHNDTFLGYPVSNPQFVMLTKLVQPNDVQWAEGSAVPLWGKIAQFLVNYYQIPPDRTTTQ